jgi:[protein-PII] uridylyltransferase
VAEDYRHTFERARERVRSAVLDAGVRGPEAAELHTAEVDELVVDAFARALDECSRSDGAGVALVALGGYGRRELTPASDLDLLLLHRGLSTGAVSELHRALMYPLWDAGRQLGDRIREPREVLASLDHLEEAAAFLDARFLTGDHGLFGELHGSVMRRMDRGRDPFFAHLWQGSKERHERFGRAGHLLEPNLRDSAGGLRDTHTLLWASKLLPGADGLEGLVAGGRLTEFDRRLVADARAFLLRLRIALHLMVGRHQDHLDLEAQDEVAATLGYRPTSGRAPADVLMQELYHHAREVEAIVRAFWERATRRRPRRLFRAPDSENVGDGCVLQEGQLEVVATTHLRDDVVGWLRVFLRSIRLGVPLSRASLARLRYELAEAGEPVWSAGAREVFLEIIGSGQASIEALVSMDGTGLLPALIPEWEPVRCLPQRDLYHRFTVDMHLFGVVAELADAG